MLGCARLPNKGSFSFTVNRRQALKARRGEGLMRRVSAAEGAEFIV
jgi:hypothetical protein